MNWGTALPAQPGTYLWRKSAKWEPIERRVFVGSHGRLAVASHRFNAETPLRQIGGEWFLPPVKTTVTAAFSFCEFNVRNFLTS